MSGAPVVFDTTLLPSRRVRAGRIGAPGSDFLLARAIDDLVDRLFTVTRRFEHALDLGTPTYGLADALQATGQVDEIRRLPLESPMAEALGLETGSLDLATSALAFQWVNDLPGVFVQLRRALRPDGLLLASLIGGETLTELRDVLTSAESELRGGASPRVAPFAEVRTIGALLQRAGFALPVTDVDRMVVRYDTLVHLMRDLRAMGATNILAARDPRPLTRAILARAAELYAERYADADGRIRATFEIISLSGWTPHESQPKPLQPGAARLRGH